MDRDKKIIEVSIKGIAVNLILVLFKAVVGLSVNSIAVILDAVNNLSDAFSSIITIVGTKLAAKSPDKKHPYGHGRIEYITSVVIAVIILLAGTGSMRESVGKMLHPEPANHSLVSVVIIIAAIAAKLLLGRYFIKKGSELNSQALSASGTDAAMDAVISAATLVSAIISISSGINIEPVLGAVISVFILKAGIEILVDMLSNIIGLRVDAELSKSLKSRINSYKEVLGTYDLMLHSYGPERFMGSVHIEVRDDMTASEIHALTRKIAMDIYSEFSIILTLGIYASNSSSEESVRIRKKLESIASDYPAILQTHGFYLDKDRKIISFDLVMDFSEVNPDFVVQEVEKRLERAFDGYSVYAAIDSDISD